MLEIAARLRESEHVDPFAYTTFVTVRISRVQKALLKRLAEHADCSMSDYMREATFSEVRALPGVMEWLVGLQRAWKHLADAAEREHLTKEDLVGLIRYMSSMLGDPIGLRDVGLDERMELPSLEDAGVRTHHPPS